MLGPSVGLSWVRVKPELTTQPRFRGAPFTLGGRWRYVEHAGDFFDRQSAESAKFHDSCQLFIGLGQLLEGQVESQDRYPIGRRCLGRLLNRHSRHTVTALSGVTSAGVVDQYSAHHLRSCTKEVSPGLPVDVALLDHALWNLLDNAVKYSTEPHLVTVSVRDRGGAIAIAVADQGFGIPAGERQSVFQKFIRGSGSVRRGIKGTGLGLAMVSHIIAAHGGRIELETEEGRGSTFTILLPAAPAADSCLKTARAEDPSIRRREEYMRRSDA